MPRDRRIPNFFADKKHVNTAKMTRANVSRGSGDGFVNCAVCTAAAVANLSLSRNTWSSGMVASFLGKNSDGKTTMGDAIGEQIACIKAFGEPVTGRSTQQIGDSGDEVPGNIGRAFMKSFPEGTTFAVYLSIPPRTEGWHDGLSHWLNGVKKGDDVEFIDFQPNHRTLEDVGQYGLNADKAGKAISGSLPVLGITGQEAPEAKMVVIAFPPPVESTGAAAAI